MAEQVEYCPLCHCTEHQRIDRRTFRGYSVINVVCQKCGFVYQSPCMTEQDLAEFYKQTYRRIYQGSDSPITKDLTIQQQRAVSLVKFVTLQISELHSCLDIGSSAGVLLTALNNQYQCKSVGVEPGDQYREYAARQGIEVYSLLEVIPDQRFELISMVHVLEHIAQPVEYLKHLRQKYLSNPGWLLIEVPNLYAHDCFEVAHLTSFSHHTLVETLRQTGFEILSLKLHGRLRSEILPLYITVLARPLNISGSDFVPVHKEAFVLVKRRLAMFKRRVFSKLFPTKAWLPISGE